MNQERYGLRAELPLQLKGMHSHCLCWRTASSFWNGLVQFVDLLGVRHWSFFLDLMVANANHWKFLFMSKDFVGESFNLCGLFYPFVKWTQWKKYTHTVVSGVTRSKKQFQALEQSWFFDSKLNFLKGVGSPDHCKMPRGDLGSQAKW